MAVIRDNKNLLETMLDDWDGSPALFQLDPGIRPLYAEFAEALRARPLEENIKKRIRGLTAIYGCDLPPTQSPEYKLQNNKTIDPSASAALLQALKYLEGHPREEFLPYGISVRDLEETAYRICELFGRACGVESISKIEMSPAHHPEYCFDIDGRKYSYAFLYYYLHYAYCAQFIDFSRLENVIEIGAGSGRQVEIIKRFHPHVKFYLLDIGPTLYFCNQYLEAVFPKDMEPYEANRSSTNITIKRAGGIACLGSWQIENVRPEGSTLSFNSAVLCISKA